VRQLLSIELTLPAKTGLEEKTILRYNPLSVREVIH
jgi:hypothetical protein